MDAHLVHLRPGLRHKQRRGDDMVVVVVVVMVVGMLAMQVVVKRGR